ncbi:dihydroxyacetone kinase family protein [Streptomyces sp. NBC_01446]|uniref:dihydroxyacetone kinase family protein n=1 Tax=Streptomyces sp. NBC_01446 TaxID=2903870 RepID=UPI00225A273E|nr:dihydroxyacetone kinase family protein [Streptomyces sp. NBC_01446]MCX4641608.1 dihydroxyacetone kinase family protein [Streptomyces sp. NBC_01446]
MTRLYADPARFSEDQLRGFAAAHPEHATLVPGGVIRTGPLRPGQVAVVVGGGSGHYPAFSGLVGGGLAAGAVVGNIFTSPSSRQAESVARAADAGGGVLYCFGNYAGDRMNFGMAQARLRDAGIDTRTVLVTDDVASAPADQSGDRRGIAGDFTVFKVAGAAAEEGLTLDAVEAAAHHANAATYSFGIAFAGCTMPGADAPLFTVPEGKMAIGLGIHGEPGVEDADMADAPTVARILVDRLLAERPATAGSRVAAILNGLGATKYEELFLLWGHVGQALAEAGLTVVRPEVGELVTSLDMAACSLTLMWLDEDLERWWCAPADAPGFRRLPLPVAPAGPRALPDTVPETPDVRGDEPSRSTATTILDVLHALQHALHDAADELGRIDAVAGDGDHGRGMAKGVDAAVRAAEQADSRSAGARSLLSAAADAWADEAGGTSGVLWGVGLRALAQELGDTGAADAARAAAGARAAFEAVTTLGGAAPGDKTLVDALAPLVDTFTAGIGRGDDTVSAFARAAAEAGSAAEATAALTPRLGRARPLAQRSVGTPDPGALSLALCARTASDLLAD